MRSTLVVSDRDEITAVFHAPTAEHGPMLVIRVGGDAEILLLGSALSTLPDVIVSALRQSAA